MNLVQIPIVSEESFSQNPTCPHCHKNIDGLMKDQFTTHKIDVEMYQCEECKKLFLVLVGPKLETSRVMMMNFRIPDSLVDKDDEEEEGIPTDQVLWPIRGTKYKVILKETGMKFIGKLVDDAAGYTKDGQKLFVVEVAEKLDTPFIEGATKMIYSDELRKMY